MVQTKFKNETIQLAPTPKGRLTENNFDLIIGISVMSHPTSPNFGLRNYTTRLTKTAY